MYLYLYAPFLKDKKYAREIALFEGRITDFGISGKIAQLSQFLKFPAAIKEFGLKRLNTLVLVGDDALLEEAVNQFALTSTVLAYIPMTESAFASALSLPFGSAAVDALAARRIEKLDIGRVANRFFFGTLRCEGKGIELHSPTFSIFPTGYTSIEVSNLHKDSQPGTIGKLEVRTTPLESGLFKKKITTPTVLHLESCRLKAPRAISVQCGNSYTFKTPLQIDIVPSAIKMIIGNRSRIPYSSTPTNSKNKNTKNRRNREN